MSDINTYDKAVDLAESLTITNVHWNDWERQFIQSFAEKVKNGEAITFSPRQVLKIDELWAKL